MGIELYRLGASKNIFLGQGFVYIVNLILWFNSFHRKGEKGWDFIAYQTSHRNFAVGT